jgi:hypothetical protein
MRTGTQVVLLRSGAAIAPHLQSRLGTRFGMWDGRGDVDHGQISVRQD